MEKEGTAIVCCIVKHRVPRLSRDLSRCLESSRRWVVRSKLRECIARKRKGTKIAEPVGFKEEASRRATCIIPRAHFESFRLISFCVLDHRN